MTVDKIIKGVSKALFNEFGGGYRYYQENVKGELEPPYFYIRPVETYVEPCLSGMRKRINKLMIRFMAEEGEDEKRDLNEIYERLIPALELIRVDEKLYRGTKMRSRIEDGVLLFFVNYDYFLIPAGEKIYMERLSQKGGLKNGG